MGKRKCCSCCTPYKCLITTIVIGVLLAVFGAASIPLFADLYEKAVKKQLVMEKGNEAYNNWHNAPTPVYMQYYCFNYTNVDDIATKKAKPNVTQVGPYSYREVRINYVTDYNDYDITYMQNYSYVFDPATSCADCTQNDTIYTPNTAMLTILKILHNFNITHKSGFMKKMGMRAANLFLEAEGVTLFKHLSIYQLLWGYEEPVLRKLKKLEDALKIFKLKLPKIDPFVALQHNGSKEAKAIGNLTLLTGKRNVDDVQRIVKWRGLDTAPYWRNKYGDMINGSDGTHFKPFTERTDTLYMFVTDICRSLYLDYDSDKTVQGIKLYRFTTTEKLFANHYINPDNIAFCGKHRCWGSGLLPISQCQPSNPPIFMSAPHFYQGDKSLIDAINGLHPVKELHATFIDVEPTTGITMEAHKRLQVNVLAQPTDFITITQALMKKDNFLPVMYIHEVSKIDKKNADKFKNEVMKPKKIMMGVEYGLMAFGIVLVLIGVIAGFWHSRKRKYALLHENSPEAAPINAEM